LRATWRLFISDKRRVRRANDLFANDADVFSPGLPLVERDFISIRIAHGHHLAGGEIHGADDRRDVVFA